MVREPNVTFDVYLKSTGEKYTSFTTDEDGYGHAELVYGTYIVKQVTSTKDYEKVDDFEVVVNGETKNPSNVLISNIVLALKWTSLVGYSNPFEGNWQVTYLYCI